MTATLAQDFDATLRIGTKLRNVAVLLMVIATGACMPRERTAMEQADRVPAAEEMAGGFDRYAPAYASQDELDQANAGCLSCHGPVDNATMHPGEVQVFVSCVDCHGGETSAVWDGDPIRYDDPRRLLADYVRTKIAAHVVESRFPDAWNDPETGQPSTANPVRSYTLLNYENPDFIRFVNPGDLRIAHMTCGRCHMDIVQKARNSMMTHGAQLWAAVLYNNGSYPHKIARFGESYSTEGVPQRLYSLRPPTDEERKTGGEFYRRYVPTDEEKARGVIEYLDPLPRWEVSQMGNIVRAFERGGKVPRQELEVGFPNVFEEPGRPDMKLSDRGLGTQLATDPVFLGIQKTRLLDPLMSFLGTNDHPGDYRSSGCSSCHVVYANDRNPVHSGAYAAAGHLGQSNTTDPTIPHREPGHPIKHELTLSIPSSQCIVCHVHPGTSYANTYLGFMWWDDETHGELMYPAEQQEPTAEQYFQSLIANPQGSAIRGLWSNLYPDQANHAGEPSGETFLEDLTERMNPKMDKTQFADFHGHGWVFRAVFKQDRKGRMLDSRGEIVQEVTPEKLQQAVAFQSKDPSEHPPADVPVHLKDIHAERGMHCVDCHFEQDNHGDGKLYSEVRNAIEIDCVDCHGTVARRTNLTTSGPSGGTKLSRSRTSFGARFVWKGDELYQRSAMEKGKEWRVPQIADTVDVKSRHYNPRAARAKLMQRDTAVWDDPNCPADKLAHGNDNMTCYACHSSWMTSCFGCHLPMRANMRMPMLHNEGEVLRNFTQYNFQVLRDDVFMIGRDSTIKGKRLAPVRSSSAVIVGSANANREWLYSQQQTVSTEGYSGQAFNPHFPHAVRKTETRSCTDCHLSEDGDNNAWLAQTYLQGTNFVNFLGRYIYVATGEEGFEAVVATEREEPQAVIGSDLHDLAYPKNFARHKENHRELTEIYEHAIKQDGFFAPRGEILDLQLRGEYLYTARGEGGFYAYDVSNIDNKGFSERIITAPVSPLGQSLHVNTKHATSIASPSTVAVDPTRGRLSDDPAQPRASILQPREAHHVNEEQAVHVVYAFLYVSDLHEGLVIIGDPAAGVGTLLDGDPTNNFLDRLIAFNPDGKLDGAQYVTLAGNHAYVCCKRGLIVVDVSNPAKPKIVAEVIAPDIVDPRAVAIQFRYAFVTDSEGLKVVDITLPEQPRFVSGANVPLEDAHRIYVARTYAYVAGGSQGLVIINVENAEHPVIDQVFTADGVINDARDVKVGMTNASLFAYVADGHNGLRIVQLISPRETPGYSGFSPRPSPRLIATRHTHGPALAISKGLDRDRAVDESGNQVAVFGRIGARPLSLEEQRALYLRETEEGLRPYTVTDEVKTDPVAAGDESKQPEVRGQ